MILSASVNADVPAHHGAWFKRRLEAGFLRVAGSDAWQQRRIELAPSNIEGIVFWTRDVEPFLPVLDELRARGLTFVVQYAVIGDPPAPAAKRAVNAMRRLAQAYGPRAVVWRYDPVLLDAAKTPAWHSQTFAGIARSLSGIVDEVVIAYARAHHRRDSLLPAGEGTGMRETTLRRDLVRQLAPIALECRMKLAVCADADVLAPGSSPARCIDARRLADIAGRGLEVPTGGFMPDCLCARAIDIGDHGGGRVEFFCGADPKRRRGLRHDPTSEFLFDPRGQFKPGRSGDLPF